MATITLCQYLFERLRQLGLESMHGVPGDYNLVALDYLGKAGLKWVGDANELNAGYAADGYARVKGLGALLTTFGVGELSAVNAIAGSFAEHVPIVHIAGSPSTMSQRDHMLLHHTLGNGDFSVFSEIYKKITVAQANLHNISTACAQIDTVLTICLTEKRPVYIELPTDMAVKQVSSPAGNLNLSVPANPPEVEDLVVRSILEELEKAKQPVILVDGLVQRFNLTADVDQLVQKTNLPTFVAPMGKGAINESLPNFCGVYAGNGSFDDVRRFVEDSDVVLSIAVIKSDFNTTGFSFRLSQLNSIDINIQKTSIGYAQFDVRAESLLKALAAAAQPLDKPRFVSNAHERAQANDMVEKVTYPAGTVTHDYLWLQLSTWLQPNDVVITETGTSYLGIWDTQLPTGAKVLSQTLWGSIGYALPAAQGVALAADETKRPGRIILFEGDGSSQLTIQAIGTMLRLKLDITIILINNDGYTIERWVHGMNASYNDVPAWKYAKIPEAMGGVEGQGLKTWKITTTDELDSWWKNEEIQATKGMKFVELFMPKEDAPLTLKMVCTAAAKTNEG